MNYVDVPLLVLKGNRRHGWQCFLFFVFSLQTKKQVADESSSLDENQAHRVHPNPNIDLCLEPGGFVVKGCSPIYPLQKPGVQIPNHQLAAT